MKLFFIFVIILFLGGCNLFDAWVKDENTWESYYLTPKKVFSGAQNAKQNEKQHNDMLNDLDKIVK